MPREFDMGDGTPPSKGEVQDLKGGHAKTVLAVLTPVLGALSLFGGFVWQASRYPDRAEFDEVKRELRASLAAADRRTSAIEKDVAVTTVKVDEISKTTDRIENKLDEKRRR